MSGNRGQAEFTEYIITFLIGIIAIIVIYALVVTVYNNLIAREINDELNQLETQTLTSIIKLYNNGASYSGNIQNNSAILLGSVNLNYPPRVAKKSYEITLISPNTLYSTVNVSANTTNTGAQSYSGPKIIGRSVETPIVEVTVNIPNIDIVAQGIVFNGLNPTLSFYKANINGTLKNVVTLGNVTLLASIMMVG